MQRRTLPQRLRAALGALFDSTNWQERYRRPLEQATTRKIQEEVNPQDRLTMVSDSRKLYANLGPCKGAVDAKAMYAVGRSWLPRYEGADKAWGDEARNWLLNEWYPLADIGGEDFQTALYLLSVAVDVEGDAGAMLTEYDTGFPAIQLLPGVCIGNRKQESGKKLTGGEYSGLRLVDGVVTNAQGRAVAYYILGDASDGSEDKFISARDMSLLKEPQFIGQPRGFPAFAGAILDLKDLRTVQGYEKIASMLAASIGLIEWSETGMADMTDPRNALGGGLTLTDTVEREMGGGTVKLYKAGTGAKLEQFHAARPGDAFERLRDHLLRTAMSSINWHYELCWDMSKLGGANTRFIISSAQRTVEDRQDLLKPFAKRAVGYAVAKAIKLGKLKPNADWWKWGFTMPSRMTADYGRDKAQDREDYIHGIVNLSDICAENGTDLDEHIAQRKAENDKLVAAGLPLPMTPQQAQVEVTEIQSQASKAKPEPEPKKEDDATLAAVNHVARIAELAIAKQSAPAPVAEPQAQPTPRPFDAEIINIDQARAELERFNEDIALINNLQTTLEK